MKNLYLTIVGMLLLPIFCANIQAQNQREVKKVTVWDGNSWSNGAPTLEAKAIFTANFTTTENLLAEEIEVQDGVQLKIDGSTQSTIASFSLLLAYFYPQNFNLHTPWKRSPICQTFRVI